MARPKSANPAQNISIYFPPAEIAAIDAEAKILNMDRSNYLKFLIASARRDPALRGMLYVENGQEARDEAAESAAIMEELGYKGP